MPTGDASLPGDSASVATKTDEEKPDIRWDTLQDRLRLSVVSISTSHCFYFGHASAASFNATGFVVDAEQGIILSNRHVMGPGPSFHKATFFNNQELFLQPTYYDPIHDFAFFRYDPADLKNSFVPKEIKLAPEKARSGMEFRIVGNNANEKMSVHQGELSQLDRNAPDYGANTYVDFNTFYYQASSTSHSGSSGSPVVDVEGDAVALNAGSGCSSSSSFFLPLERVVYALDYVRRWEIPPRGTLQAVFKHITHVQAAHLGLDPEAAAREGVLADATTGVLSVDKVLPGGPADGKLEVGDIVVGVEGRLNPAFTELFEVIDSLVGRQVSLRIFSHGEFRTVTVDVMDLYDITPSQFLCIGGAILHNLSLQLCFYSSARITGVYIAWSGCGFFPNSDIGHRKVIQAVNGVSTPDLPTLMGVLQHVGRDDPIVVKVIDHRDPRDEAVFVTRVPPLCIPGQVFTRSKVTGFWSREPFMGMSSLRDTMPALVNGVEQPAISDSAISEAAVDAAVGLAQGIEYAVVSILSNSACPASGQYNLTEKGNGFIVCKQRGIVLCSTRLVRNPTSILSITFLGLVSVSATLAFVHPLYPVAFLKYNPVRLHTADNDVDRQLVELDLSSLGNAATANARLVVGSRGTVLMGKANGGLEVVPTSVSGRRQLSTNTCSACLDQRFYNTEVFSLSPEPDSSAGDLGVVCDTVSHIRGLWVRLPCCYHDRTKKNYVGLDMLLLLPALESLRASDVSPDVVRVLDVEFKRLTLETAKVLGVGYSHIRELAQASPVQRGVFMVCNILRKRQPEIVSLEVGDVVLKVGDKRAWHMDDLACLRDSGDAVLTVVRNGKEILLTVPTTSLAGKHTRRVIYWAGMFIQEPHLTALEQASCPWLNVFSSVLTAGSPIDRELNGVNFFITEIDGRPIVTLDDVAHVAREIKSPDIETFNSSVASGQRLRGGKIPGRFVKVSLVKLTGEKKIVSLHTHDLYNPAWQIHRGPLISDDWVWEKL
ncbi:hypothetical protein GGI13_000261 [Coemansia sp. RSA 455]|nr:hypothetical protein GGI13_000261 [Coemansia sp. RSA 455]